MFSSTATSVASSSFKKLGSRTKKSKPSIADSSALERRSWEAWNQREECIFFDSLVRNSRNWGAIAADIGSKRSEQVRTYYYRVLRKISRLLQAVHFNFDNRDRINTLIALLAFWEAKCETQYEEATIEFADAIKGRILRQRQELDAMRSKRHPTPEKLTIQLVPSTEEVASLLLQAGHNPKLQLTLKSKKTMASIVEHLNSKWTAQNGGPICDTPLRLYIPDKLAHSGYGAESHDVTILSVFHAMNCPTICRLEYSWNMEHGKMIDGVLPGHEHQELGGASDEGSDDHSYESSSAPVYARDGANTSVSQIAAESATLPSTGGVSGGRQSPPTTSATVASTTGNSRSNIATARTQSMQHHSSGASSRPSSHSPRNSSGSPQRPVNRLAVPENIRASSKAFSEDALDDDAVRQGQLMRQASKLAAMGSAAGGFPSGTSVVGGTGIVSGAPTSGINPNGKWNASRTTRSSGAPASTVSNASANALPARNTRYITRSRKAAAVAATSTSNPGMKVDPSADASNANHDVQMVSNDNHQSHHHPQQSVVDVQYNQTASQSTSDEDHSMSMPHHHHHHHHHQQHHHAHQHMQQHMVQHMTFMMSGDDEDEDMMTGDVQHMTPGHDMYATEAAVSDLEQLEPLPPMEYGFGGAYVDVALEDALLGPSTTTTTATPSGVNSSSSASGIGGRITAPGAHLGVAGLSHTNNPTMVVNNHYYQPTWDHSQSYFMGTTPQASIDPYYAAYPNPMLPQQQQPQQPQQAHPSIQQQGYYGNPDMSYYPQQPGYSVQPTGSRSSNNATASFYSYSK